MTELTLSAHDKMQIVFCDSLVVYREYDVESGGVISVALELETRGNHFDERVRLPFVWFTLPDGKRVRAVAYNGQLWPYWTCKFDMGDLVDDDDDGEEVWDDAPICY